VTHTSTTKGRELVGTLSNDDANAKENVIEIVVFGFLFYLAIIPTRLTCLMWPNCAETEFVGLVLKSSKRKKNPQSFVPVVQKTLKLVISRCCFAEDGKEIYQNV